MIGSKIENFENGGPIMLPSFRVPTPAPRGCGRAPIVNSVPAGGARLRGGGGVVAPTGRPEAIHGTFYDLLVAGRVFKVFKGVGQRAKGRRHCSLRTGGCPSGTVDAGSPPQGAGDETGKL